MKCYQKQIFLGLLLFFAFTKASVASASISITGDNSQANSASISWNDASNDGSVYLFLNGVSLGNNAKASANAADANSDSPKNMDSSYWSPAYASLPYATGDYQAIIIASDFFYNRNSHCGTGVSSSSCISAVLGNGLGGRVETSTVYTVTTATSSPTSTVSEVSNPQLNVILIFFLFVISFAVMLYSYHIYRLR